MGVPPFFFMEVKLMAAVCTVCRHPDTEAISMDLLQGSMPMRDIAKRYGLSLSAVARHKKHIPAQLAVSTYAKKVAKADTVMERIQELDRRADEIYEKAKEEDPALALKALKEIREAVALYAKMTGELKSGTVHNTLIVTPEWVSLRAVMLKALQPYPEARQALVEALGGVENVRG